MKKAIFAVLLFLVSISYACADCTVNVAWTPSASADATQHELIYFNGSADVIKATYPALQIYRQGKSAWQVKKCPQ